MAVVAVLIFSSCCDEKTTKIEKEIITKKDSSEISNAEHQLMSTLWFQKSAEAQAVYYQTYNYAKIILDNILKKDRFKIKKKKPKAIITDIDETVLNNSPYNAGLISEGKHYEKESWSKWVNEKKAKALPGALDFCNYAKEKGIEIFYVSNRSIENLKATSENLKNAGFPYSDEKHIFLKDKTSDKTARRNKILQNYDVILFLGDNLRDFDENFKYTENTNRNDSIDISKDLFGTKYIIFPNPMYGEWEKAAYKGDFGKTNAEKRKMIIDALDKN